MLEPDGPTHHGDDIHGDHVRGRKGGPPSELLIPKNRSTSNLVGNAPKSTDRSRIRFSFDAGMVGAGYDPMSRSPIMTDHEHGLGASGLSRIRQPPSRVPTIPPSEASSRNPSVGPPSGTSTYPNSRTASMAIPSGASSPTLNFTEDLTRFPSESLHSFSFAHQAEEFTHNRQNILKRSVEFMTQKLGWAHTNMGIVSAQARVTGDAEMQSMLDLLARAKLVGGNNIAGSGEPYLAGPFTGPATLEHAENVFDADFGPRSTSPELLGSPRSLSPGVSKPTLLIETHIDEPQTSESQNEGSAAQQPGSEGSSRTPTNESRTTAMTSPPASRRQSLLRTYSDVAPVSLRNKLMEALSQTPVAGEFNDQLLSPTVPQSAGPWPTGKSAGLHPSGHAVHGHSSRWTPAAQAIFTTESTAPYTILAANDLACLVFGVTKAEVRKMGILEVVREERRAWLEERLQAPGTASGFSSGKQSLRTPDSSQEQLPSSSNPAISFLFGRSGVTANLLNRPNSRQTQKPARRAQTDDGAGSSLVARAKAVKGGLNHLGNKSRGVLLCGDVVPIQKRNGATGSASLWVKEKRGGLIWVLEEIHEDVVVLGLSDDAKVTKIDGSTTPIWGENIVRPSIDIGKLIPRLPRQGIDSRTGEIDYAEVVKRKFFTARNAGQANIPCLIDRVQGSTDLRVSSFPHIAGIIVLSAETLTITSSNSAFSAALFGQEKPDGRPITDLIPDFDRILKILTEEDGVHLADGIVIPEHSFRYARAYLALRDGKPDAASFFLQPNGLPAKHRDGSEIKIDVQLRVVKSDPHVPHFDENVIEERSDDEGSPVEPQEAAPAELVYALWVTFSRQLHSPSQGPGAGAGAPIASGIQTPHQPSPGQTEIASPVDMDSDSEPHKREVSHASLLTSQLREVAKKTASKFIGRDRPVATQEQVKEKVTEVVPPHKKVIDDFVILEEMGQGAYGQVKLARYKKNGNRKVVLKYVTKRRILVDTWTRDRRLGTVPLEIHVLDYLRRDGLKHPNIVEMVDFFEDDVNYYIEMVPHGLPGMDLFDYIELRVNMEEDECRSIFVQVVRAIHHLHTKALVVHRDIKDENVVLDGEGNIKLIDFGSAAYIKNSPFDVFVGTIDYAAPEVLAGKPYHGPEQDVWALGILLYTIIYKENPFYSIDEIMDRDLRIPYVMSEESIDLIRAMLDRNVESRVTIDQVLEHPWCLSGEAD
ncbi:Protein kinase-like (PK-like) [Venustampulla echinocandica]|uniref:non-specific serine/threonine protein kinase n=1 Tax=Venustampulla echinocandica TaxID=2656787 RepID=A0A370TYK8_9HELO|nr:Protein kinase-like (PK-like) [Venustampulla echinocandica]RDL40598.1 Protein kinase-like (PK-like) [Venustampulla echinocandica]